MLDKQVKNFIQSSFRERRVACLTGAGISSESGIPTFRGKDGLWQKYDPQTYATADGLLSLLRDAPHELVNFITDFYAVLLKARPNSAHDSLALLEKEGVISSVITQNIDNLHQEAGSRNIIELHGNAFRIICSGCGRAILLERERLKEFTHSLAASRDSYRKLLKVLSRYFPRCGCGSRCRIDIILFGETLPEDELSRAYQEAEKCDVLLVIGSSLAVYPAAGIPLYAKEKGATVIEVNNEPSAWSSLYDYSVIGKASEIIPEIASMLTR